MTKRRNIIPEDFVQKIVENCMKRLAEGQYDDEEKKRQKQAAMERQQAQLDARQSEIDARKEEYLKRRYEAESPKYNWGRLNRYLFDNGHPYFEANTRPGTFIGEELRIPTMDKKRVVFPDRDEKGNLLYDEQGNIKMRAGFRDVKSVYTKGVFTGPVYQITWRVGDKIYRHITTDHRLYAHKVVENNPRVFKVKQFDPGVWIKGDAADRMLSGRRNTAEIKIKLLAVEAGLIDDYHFTEADNTLKRLLKIDQKPISIQSSSRSQPSLDITPSTTIRRKERDRGGIKRDPFAKPTAPIKRSDLPPVEPTKRPKIKPPAKPQPQLDPGERIIQKKPAPAGRGKRRVRTRTFDVPPKD